MSATVEIDQTLKSSIKLLHSHESDSAEKIRLVLDELIKQKHGSSKMLINTMSKKHLAEEKTSPGSNLVVRKQKHIERKLSANPASAVTSPETINIPDGSSLILTLSDNEIDEDDDDSVVEVEDRMKELEDLCCVSCRRMELTARNRLVECADCHSLYHQECHKPSITEEDANDHAWICSICKGKSTPKTSSPSPSSRMMSPKSSKNYESSSSSTSSGKHKASSKSESSSSKSSRKDKEREKDRHEKQKEKDRHREKHSKSREKDREKDGEKEKDKEKEKDREMLKPSSSSSTSSVSTPSINIISADKRFQSIKKKLQESKRKHK